MIDSRKLTSQLTPLLDLLLIVIFAQYLDVESTTRRETVQLEQSRDLLAAQLDEAVRQLVAVRERMLALQDEVEIATGRSQEAERFRVQRDLIGELVAEMFRVPEAALAPLLQQRQAGGPGPSSSDLAAVRRQLQNLSGDAADRVVDHLLTFGEMRKRIDIWELYLTDAGLLVLSIGDKRFQFRAESAEDVAARLFEAYKSLPEPKTMVLILLSYGDARFGPLKATLDGLPNALQQIRADTAGRSRFEFAVLGFRPGYVPNR